MKVVVEAKSLVEAINWSVKDYDAKDSNAYVYLHVTPDGEASMSYFGQTYLSAPINVVSVNYDKGERKKDLKVALDGIYMKRLTGVLNGQEEATIEAKSDDVKVTTNNGGFHLTVLGERRPSVPNVQVIGEVDDNVFLDYMSRASKLCDTSTGNMLTASVSLTFDNNKLRNMIKIFATDRYELTEICVDYTPEKENDENAEFLGSFYGTTILLPQESAGMISPTRGVTVPLTIIGELDTKTDNLRFGYRFANGRSVLFSLSDAKPFADIEKVKSMGNSVDSNFVVNVRQFTDMIKKVSSLSLDEDDKVILNIDADGIVISDVTENNKMVIDAEIDEFNGEETARVVFKRDVLLKGIIPVASQDVRISWDNGADGASFTLKPVTEDGDNDDVFIVITRLRS